MNWLQAIDAYCERTDATFWSEPLNAVSNIAFLAVPVLVLWLTPKDAAKGRTEIGLVILVFLIGIGSFLFHTFATRWSALADVLPITIFILCYFAYALARFVGLGWIGTVIGIVLFFTASRLIDEIYVPIIGSSSAYLPGLFALFGIGAVLASAGHPAARLVLTAGAVFLVSLAFRIADAPLCEAWPYGTHFMWHILNALTLGLLLYTGLDKGHAPSVRARRASG